GGPGRGGGKTGPFLDAWTGVERGHPGRSRWLAGDNAVLGLVEPTGPLLRTPVGDATAIAIQSPLARGLLAGSRLREAPAAATAGIALVMAALVAGVSFPRRGWGGVLGAPGLARGHLAA